jgi:CDP-diacylglycerol--glycerol-3-phosphate 3-phosphatidyltransferase
MQRFWRGRTMADQLTLSRVAAAPLIIGAALLHSPRGFAVLLAWGLLSDIADGALARARGEVTPAGATLDSRADVAFYGSTLLALGILIPARLAGEWRLLAVVIAAYALPIALGWWKFGRLTAYHTVLARLALALLVTGLGSWIMFDQLTLLRLGVAVLVVSAVEEILLTLLLDSALNNVGHLLAAPLPHPRLLDQCLHSLGALRKRPRVIRQTPGA